MQNGVSGVLCLLQAYISLIGSRHLLALKGVLSRFPPIILTLFSPFFSPFLSPHLGLYSKHTTIRCYISIFILVSPADKGDFWICGV